MRNSDSIQRTTNFIVILAFACAVVALVLYLLAFGVHPSLDMAVWGQTGDFFGGVLNPVFGFLSLIALLITLQQTEKSLKQSDEEVRLSREEMKRSADALFAQANDSRQQTFERTFFELLRLYNEIVDALAVLPIPNAARPERGRDALFVLCKKFKRLVYDVSHLPEEEKPSAINDKWLDFFKSKEVQLGHYFRFLYNILKFIDQSKIENKKFYTDMLRAQLSSSELVIIHYNAHSDLGREKLLPLIKKYNLLKHLNKNDLTIV